MKTKYSMDSDFIKLEVGQELNPAIFSNESFDFKKYYFAERENCIQDITIISNLLNLNIVYHSNLFYEMFSKFNVFEPNKYNIIDSMTKNDNTFYSENIFYFDNEFKNIKVFSKYYFKELNKEYAIKLNDYKKELLNKYVAIILLMY